MRYHYLDNIRWVTVLLVMFFHVFYYFNAYFWLTITTFGQDAYSTAYIRSVGNNLYAWLAILAMFAALHKPKRLPNKRS